MAIEKEMRERNRALLHDLLETQQALAGGNKDALIRLIRRTITYMDAEDVAYVYQMLGLESDLPIRR